MGRPLSDADRGRLQMGMALHQQGRVAEAEAIYRAISQRNPSDPDTLYLLGLVAVEAGKFQRGADLIGRSIRLNPDFAPAHCNRGIALAALGQIEQALGCYDRAIALQPDFAGAHFNRGVLLGKAGRLDEAIRALQAAVAAQPDFPEALSSLGDALNKAGRHEQALEVLHNAIRLQPGFADAHCHRGNALLGLDRPEEALASYDRALALRPELAEAWCNRGEALSELQRPADAMASFDHALRLRPDLAEAEFGLSLVQLAVGRYQEGFRHHEARLRRNGFVPARTFAVPPWLGRESLSGKTLFIYPELFLGDMIQFCRYAKLAQVRGASVVLAVQPALRDVLRSLGPGISFVAPGDPPPRFDLHCPLMSLPLAFGTTQQSVPAAVPYLHPDPARVEAWRERIGAHGFRIGVCWHGSAQRLALQRSFPAAMLRDIARLPGIRLISLQTGPGAEQCAALPDGMVIEDYPAAADAGGLRPFADAAAIMANVDLVISLDSAIAHLAGALGRPLWLALKRVADWRWGLAGETTPWYPTARLFRQTTRNEWTPVFAAMHQALRNADPARH